MPNFIQLKDSEKTLINLDQILLIRKGSVNEKFNDVSLIIEFLNGKKTTLLYKYKSAGCFSAEALIKNDMESISRFNKT